jgi:Kef-type K+ transport system membrane component KefB
MLCRCAGTWAGAWLGARLARADRMIRKWMGWCLLPQAGVSLGMALLASQRFPQFESFLLPVVLASTIIFEVTTPLITRRALTQAAQNPDAS